MVADVDRGQPLDASDAQAARGIGAEDRNALGAGGMPLVEKPSRGEVGAHRAEQIRRGGAHRELERGLIDGSTTGEALTRASWTLTSLSRPAATTPFSRTSRSGASHGMARGSIVPVAIPGRAVMNSSVAAS